MPRKIQFFGDSHARYLHLTSELQARIGLTPPGVEVAGKVVRAGSVMGFRRGKTTLRTRSMIKKFLPQTDLLVLGFGQVDLELGYYYRRVIKGEDISGDEFLDTLVGIYREFVESFNFPAERLALKGVNLTVLAEPEFSYEYIKRIVFEAKPENPEEKAAKLKAEILDETRQNDLHMSFNQAIKSMIEERGGHYFDINDAIAERDNDGGLVRPLRLDRRFMPSENDHHICDSLYIRKLHHLSMLEAFDLSA